MTSQEKLFATSAYDCGYQQGYDDGKHDGRADERKQIVAWLRDVSWPHRNDALIAAIEEGEHLK